jgi:hypothetical protein
MQNCIYKQEASLYWNTEAGKHAEQNMSYTVLLVKASNKVCDMLFIQDVTQK